MKNYTPIIINVPHASTYIPGEELPYFCREKLEREILSMTDHFCDDIFDHGNDPLPGIQAGMRLREISG